MTKGEGGHHKPIHTISSIEMVDSVRIAHLKDPRIFNIRCYSKPNQRQRWGDTQTHPVVDYGDLFFDLFFVGAAYNLSNIIRYSPTAKGFLYFVACFWAVYLLWWDKVDYDSRFFTYDDAFHRIFSVSELVVLASAVVHIRPAEVLSSPTENVEPFALCISLLFAKILSICRYLEMLIIGCVGDNAALATARRVVLLKTCPVALLLVATIYTGLQFYQNMGNKEHQGAYRMLPEGQNTNQDDFDTTDIPIYLILSSSAVYMIGLSLTTFMTTNDFKKVSVPMNVTYAIHRIGEWVMLMLGESILSMLIVASPSSGQYYLSFFCGILSIILLQYLHFRSQPSSADEHAIRRKRSAGLAFASLIQIYSAALILLGVSYEMLLYGYTDDYSTDPRRSLLLRLPRWLGVNADDASWNDGDRRIQVAHFFSASFAVVYFCSDAMLLTHRGLSISLTRCQCQKSKRTKPKGVAVILVRVGICVFMATLSQWLTDPTTLSVVGLASIILQILLRFVATDVFMDERVHVEVRQPEGIDDGPGKHDEAIVATSGI